MEFTLSIDNINITLQSDLSEREQQCLCLLARGYTMKESAQALSLSPRTVESYLKNLKNKLNMNRFELIKLYWQDYFQ